MLPGAETNADVSGFVLAGGQSSRMGSDKALVRFRGRPLIENALEILSCARVDEIRIAGARRPLDHFAGVVPDTFADIGPLGGIHAGLAASGSDWSLFFPVDMPLMPSSLLTALVQRAGLTCCPITATRMNGRIEPFPVVLHRCVLAALTDAIESGRTGCLAAWQLIPREFGHELDAPHVEFMLQSGQCQDALRLPPAFWYLSANTPEDLAYLSGFAGIASERKRS